MPAKKASIPHRLSITWTRSGSAFNRFRCSSFCREFAGSPLTTIMFALTFARRLLYMRKPTSIGVLLVFLFVACSGIIATAGAQDNAGKDAGKKDKKEKKKKDDGDAGSARDSKPVLWRDPGDIESLDLYAGPGGAGNAPDPGARYTFVSRSMSGTSEKINVEDDKKREWQVKFGAEAKVGPAASRIVWAAGYHVDVDYFVKKSHVEGRGGFDIWDVRFKPKDDFKEDGLWSWHANPFMGTRELDGLKTL